MKHRVVLGLLLQFGIIGCANAAESPTGNSSLTVAATPATSPATTPPPSAPRPLVSTPQPKATPVRPPDAIVGRWRLGDTVMVFAADGTFESSKPNYFEKGVWKIVSTATPPKYEFSWSGGRKVEQYSRMGDKLQRRTPKGWEDVGNRLKQ